MVPGGGGGCDGGCGGCETVAIVKQELAKLLRIDGVLYSAKEQCESPGSDVNGGAAGRCCSQCPCRDDFP